ncbi:hypothetical protein BVX98_04890 [bacterium F11]|nr:hypothetical protein BVX98_04890 [bacterium F11]
MDKNQREITLLSELSENQRYETQLYSEKSSQYGSCLLNMNKFTWLISKMIVSRIKSTFEAPHLTKLLKYVLKHYRFPIKDKDQLFKTLKEINQTLHKKAFHIGIRSVVEKDKKTNETRGRHLLHSYTFLDCRPVSIRGTIIPVYFTNLNSIDCPQDQLGHFDAYENIAFVHQNYFGWYTKGIQKVIDGIDPIMKREYLKKIFKSEEECATYAKEIDGLVGQDMKSIPTSELKDLLMENTAQHEAAHAFFHRERMQRGFDHHSRYPWELEVVTETFAFLHTLANTSQRLVKFQCAGLLNQGLSNDLIPLHRHASLIALKRLTSNKGPLDKINSDEILELFQKPAKEIQARAKQKLESIWSEVCFLYQNLDILEKDLMAV